MNISNAIKLVKSTTKLQVSSNKIVTIILDAAHGKDVAGKCSPDGKFREYKWSRFMISKLEPMLRSLGYKVYQTNETDVEIGLTKRKNIANSIKGENKLLLSIHNNAAGGDGKWHTATGIEFYTSRNQTVSDVFAECLYKSFSVHLPEERYRVDNTDGDSDKESNFTVLMGSSYWACLAEIMFQDTKEDVAKLNDEAWCEKCASAFVTGIEHFNWLLQNS